MNMTTHCGHIAIVGRPNVGKSTLLNQILETKLSITSRKPQTTRHQILGIKTQGDKQMIFVDTPGMHLDNKGQMNRYLNKAASSVVHDVDVVVFVIEHLKWTDEDDWVLKQLEHVEVPVILVVNKVDKLKDKQQLLPQLQALQARYDFELMIPISARKGDNVDVLLNEVSSRLPEGQHQFAADEISDRSQEFFCTEIIREKLTRLLGQELPYSLTVKIDSFLDKEKHVEINATIYVTRKSQKAIVIGNKGDTLKQVGTEARVDIEKLIGQKAFLRLWVKVREGWSDDQKFLQSLGYESR